jgi:hypothetical protein
MSEKKSHFPGLRRALLSLALILAFVLITASSSLQAAQVWNGPLFTFNQPSPNPAQATNQDRITPDVWLTRAASKGIFNAFLETSATSSSPSNTEWAFGTLGNYASLTYTNWLGLLNGQSPTNLVGQSCVAHLLPDDIYLSVHFTFWGAGGGGGFAYQRSTPAPPNVWSGPLFTYNQPSPNPAQATNQDRITPDVWLTRAASKGLFNAFYETSATALSPTNTEWAFGTLDQYATLPYTNWLAWLNGQSPVTLLGQPVVLHLVSDNIYLSVQFTVWASGGTGGFAYQRSTPFQPVLFNSLTNVNNGPFNFTYTAFPGSNYVIQISTNLAGWLPLATNTAATTLVPFFDPFGLSSAKFFRVIQ